MNIVEAFNKLKENPNLRIKRRDREFSTSFGHIFVTFHLNAREVCRRKVIDFNFEDVLTDDWEVME